MFFGSSAVQEPSNGIYEIKEEELMVSPLGGNPSLRTAHFLKPTLKCIENPARNLLPNTLFSETTIPRPGRLNVRFRGWLNPYEEYKIWKERLHSKYEDIWRRAGIYEAIKASPYQIQRSDDLILGLAKKWYSETNTFIFSWGESTITLEDTMVLGGYSVVGSPVLTPLEDEESKEMEEKLNEVRRNLTKTRARKAAHLPWLKHFMEEKGELEHAAFLSLWLSMSVFPGSISKQCFSLAIHLSRGTRIALAPAVLASVYRDLTLLKRNIMLETGKSEKIILRAPFKLVQFWAFERFPTLQPKPKETEFNQPRIAKWHKVKMLNPERVSIALDSSGESFHWRPYTIFPKFYNENDKWVWFNSDSHQDLESFARCLMHAELVSLDEDCIEKYLPHRVAMQFGLDQDVPGRVPHCKEISAMIAWKNYNRPVKDAVLCIAAVALSSTLRPSVTSKYLEWWNQSKIGCEKKPRMDFDADVPPRFPPKCRQFIVFGNSCGLPNDESDQIGIVPSPVAIDETDTSMVDGVEILAKSKNENVVGGSKRANEDAKNNDMICKSIRIKKIKNEAIGMRGKSISPCTIEEISNYETQIRELERVVDKLKAAKFGH